MKGRVYVASRSLTLLSQINLGELCVYIISKLKNSKLTDKQISFIQKIVVSLQFYNFKIISIIYEIKFIYN